MNFNPQEEILLTLNQLKNNRLSTHSRITFWALDANYIKQPKDALRQVRMNNARPSRITAAAGTRLAGATFLKNVIIFFSNRGWRPGSFYSRLSP